VRRDKLLTATQGVTLLIGDMIDTGPKAFVAIRAPTGTLIGLGPTTSVYLLQRGTIMTLFVSKGWVKVDAKAETRIEGPRLGIQGHAAVMLLHADDRSDAVFEEQGAARLVTRDGAATHPGKVAEPGQYFSRDEHGEAVPAAHPPAEFIAGLPVAFTDSLPDEAPSSLKEVDPTLVRPVTYTDVQAWLVIPRDLRAGFVARFQSRVATDPAFHDALDAHLSLFPEWTSVLHPPPPPDNPQPSSSDSSPPEPSPTPVQGSEKQ
jgi:hypothetical protein